MAEWKGFIFPVVLFSVLIYLAVRWYTETHETAHAEICKRFDGTATIKYNALHTGGTTYCTLGEGLTQERRDTYDLAQSGVEATYYAQPLIVFLLLAVFLTHIMK